MALSYEQAHRYLTALTFGPTPESVAALQKQGLNKWVAQQLNPKFANAEGLIDSTFRAHGMNLQQVVKDPLFKAKKGHVTTELVLATVIRQSHSKRQLFEVLVEHFNDYLHTPLSYDGRLYRVGYDRDVIRKHTLGYFPAMLAAATFHPAMMMYLNLNENTAKHANENFGRELLELFSVTPSAGYSEQDVQNAAKLLTGFSWDAAAGKLRVQPAKHYFGPIKVLDFTHPNAATKDTAELVQRGLDLVNHVALLPATAKAFSIRLARRLLQDEPNPALVQQLAKVYLDSKGHIPSVVKALVESKQFLASVPTKVKRPTEFVASLSRTLNIRPVKPLIGGNLDKPNAYFGGSGAPAYANLTKAQGQLPMNWPFPNGYPDTALAWTNLSAQVQRWNVISDLVLGRLPKTWTKPDTDALFASLPANASNLQIAQAANRLALGGRLPAPKVAAIAAQITAMPSATLQQRCQTALLCTLASPEWMLR